MCLSKTYSQTNRETSSVRFIAKSSPSIIIRLLQKSAVKGNMTTIYALLKHFAENGTICSDEIHDILSLNEGIPLDAELSEGLANIIKQNLDLQNGLHQDTGIRGYQGEPVTTENLDELISRFRKE
jgi:hypothetical protein